MYAFVSSGGITYKNKPKITITISSAKVTRPVITFKIIISHLRNKHLREYVIIIDTN